MVHDLGRRVAALGIALALMVLTGCGSSPVLVKLPAETIPQSVRDAIMKRDNVNSVVWRAYLPDGNVCHVVYTYTEVIRGYPAAMYSIESFQISDGEELGGNGTGMFMPSERFYGGHGSSWDHITGYAFHADGIATDPQIKSIRGTTLDGATVAGTLVNGFWWLEYKSEDGTGDWAEIAALDEHDAVIYKVPGLPDKGRPVPPPLPPRPLPEGVTAVKLADIPASQIPEAIRKPVEQSPDRLNVVWRVNKTVGNRTMTVYTCDLVTPNGPPSKMYFMDVTETVDGVTRRLRNGGSFVSDVMFYGGTGSSKRDNGVLDYLDAHGVALDSAIARIRGITRSGLAVETDPIDGFWLLAAWGDSSGGAWESIVALDANGKVLYQMRIPDTR